MQTFTFLSRKTLLNYSSGWEFILLLHKYPIIVYVNLHNINNYKLHQLKNYMSTIGGYAQVLNTSQLKYLFNNNIKFRFLITGNLVTLMFKQWEDVWNFKEQEKKLSLVLVTVSIQGTFLNLCQHTDISSLDVLQEMFKQNHTIITETVKQISCSNNNLHNCLYQPINTTINSIWLVLYQLAQDIENFSNSIELLNTKNKLK